MAEVLGVVASGIAVSQAAQTVGGAVVSLCRLWAEVKDVPSTIQHALEELELAGNFVDAIELELGLPSSSTTHPSHFTTLQAHIIQRCRQVHRDLRDLVDHLRADIAASRRRKSLLAKTKVALKKETLENYERRLQKALRFLGLAVQLHLASSVRRQPELVAAEVTSVLVSHNLSRPAHEHSGSPLGGTVLDEIKADDDSAEPQLRLAPRAPRRQGKAILRRKAAFSSSLLGRLGIELIEAGSEDTGSFQTTSTSYRIRVAPAPWLLAKVWDFQVSLACSGWTAHFRQYVILPDEYVEYDVVVSTSFEELQQRLASRAVSPYSIDAFSRTLLHYAMVHKPDFIRPLLQLGLDFQINGFSTSVAYLHFTKRRYWESRVSSLDPKRDTTELDRVMLAQLVVDELLPSVSPVSPVGTSFSGYTVIWSFLTGQMAESQGMFESFVAHVWPDFYQWPLETRITLFGINFLLLLPWNGVGRLFRANGQFSPEDLRQKLRVGRLGYEGRTVFGAFFEHYRALHYLRAEDDTMEVGLPTTRIWDGMQCFIRDMTAGMELSDISAIDDPTDVTLLTWSVIKTAIWLWLGTSAHWNWAGELVYSIGLPRWRDWKFFLQRWVRTWVEVLHNAGHDLEAYGRSEMSLFLKQEVHWLGWPRMFRWRSVQEYWGGCWEKLKLVARVIEGGFGWKDLLVAEAGFTWKDLPMAEGGFRWKGFKFGPRPEDWDLIWEEWDPDVEELVGDFWTLVENPPLVVPGAWVEDE